MPLLLFLVVSFPGSRLAIPLSLPLTAFLRSFPCAEAPKGLRWILHNSQHFTTGISAIFLESTPDHMTVLYALPLPLAFSYSSVYPAPPPCLSFLSYPLLHPGA